MSWGFIACLEVEMSTADWEDVSSHAAKDSNVPKDWPDKSEFGAAFCSEYWLTFAKSFQAILFAKKPGWKDLEKDAVRSVETEGGKTKARVLVILDKSVLENAALLAALFYFAATKPTAKGKFVLVNDGTGPDENGWEFSLAKGHVKKKAIDDPWDYVDAYGSELMD